MNADNFFQTAQSVDLARRFVGAISPLDAYGSFRFGGASAADKNLKKIVRFPEHPTQGKVVSSDPAPPTTNQQNSPTNHGVGSAAVVMVLIGLSLGITLFVRTRSRSKLNKKPLTKLGQDTPAGTANPIVLARDANLHDTQSDRASRSEGRSLKNEPLGAQSMGWRFLGPQNPIAGNSEPEDPVERPVDAPQKNIRKKPNWSKRFAILGLLFFLACIVAVYFFGWKESVNAAGIIGCLLLWTIAFIVRLFSGKKSRQQILEVATLPPEPIPVTIAGSVRGFQSRIEQYANVGRSPAPDIIWAFRIERIDRTTGNQLPPVAVEMRGTTFEGFVNEGDEVEVVGPWEQGSIFKTQRVRNVTNQIDVVAKIVRWR